MATESKTYLDTNVIAYIANNKAPQHKAEIEIILIPTETEIWCVSSQILAEFYSYITNPNLLAKPLEPNEATNRKKDLSNASYLLTFNSFG